MDKHEIIGKRFKNLRTSQKDKHGKELPGIQMAQKLIDTQCVTNYSVNVIRQEISKVEKGKFPQLYLIEGYSKYFNVTSDYLLGLRETKTIDENIAMISKVTGLTDESIEVLKALRKGNGMDLFFYTLNHIISSDKQLFISFIDAVSLYFDNEYDTPVACTGGVYKAIDDGISSSPITRTDEKQIVIGKYNDNEKAYDAIGLPLSIIKKAYSMQTIQFTVDEWKRLLKP